MDYSLKKYILHLHKDTGKLDSKSTRVPTEQNHKLDIEEKSSVVDKESYKRLVGKLIYVSYRSDISLYQ